MARKLKTGLIYSFHYRRFTKDPNPMVLVLYCDDKICHALNFHYLHGDYNVQLIHMISKIASKSLKTGSMYSHYHNWMKKRIPGVISRAYRTYKPQHMSNVKQITKGFWGVGSFLKSLQDMKDSIKLTELQKRLSKKVSAKKAERFEKQKLNIKKVSPEKLDNAVRNYVQEMDEILEKSRKKDKSKFTYSRRNKPNQ